MITGAYTTDSWGYPDPESCILIPQMSAVVVFDGQATAGEAAINRSCWPLLPRSSRLAMAIDIDYFACAFCQESDRGAALAVSWAFFYFYFPFSRLSFGIVFLLPVIGSLGDQ
ncbi:hypothetical protein BDV19DRAFT_80105 [Aspergillus venezuelensis]